MEDKQANLSLRKQRGILFVGTYPPRKCGIATFTKDLSSAIENRFSQSIKINVLAVNDNETIDLKYPKEVVYKINKENLEEYINLAEKVNEDDIGLVCIQHEYGIFGGPYGAYLVEFLKRLNKPSIVTLHTVKDDPDEKRKEVTQDIAKYSDALVVIIKKSKETLERQYGISSNKIHVIPHGIHYVDFVHPPKEKTFFNTKDKIILSTFGLLGAKSKGIDYVIQALPEIIKEYPNVIYAIIGKVHPDVIKKGVDYTGDLKKLIKDLGVEDNVKFYDKYLELDELLKALVETDIYLTPFVEKDRKSSGTVAYAMGCGRACIATPFYFAEDIIDEGKNGFIVGFNDSEGFTQSIKKILRDPEFKRRLEKNAYEKTRHMLWDNVADDYYSLWESIEK